MSTNPSSSPVSLPAPRRKHRLLVVIAGVCAMGSSVFAVAWQDRKVPSATQPSAAQRHENEANEKQAERGGGGRGRNADQDRSGNPGPDDRPGRGRNDALLRPPNNVSRENLSREEREEVLAFIRANMPNTAAYWEETLGNPEYRTRRAWVFSHALFQYRRYHKTRGDMPDLEDRLLDDVRTTDDVLGLAIRHTRTTDMKEQQEIRGEIRQKLRKLAEGALSERKKRIERLREALAREESNLAAEESVLDENVETRVEEMINRITYGTRTSPVTPQDGAARP